MVQIVIPFDDQEINGIPFNNPEYFDAYYELSMIAMSNDSKIYFARGKNSYTGQNIFTNISYFDFNKKLNTSHDVKADVIYDKSTFLTDSSLVTCTIINNIELKNICNDKFKTYKDLADFSPYSLLVESQKNLKESIDKMSGNIVVVKSTHGFGGKEVFIGDKKEAASKDHRYPVLVQQFYDTSLGIAGLVQGQHDLRIIIRNGEPYFSYIRKPKEGEYKAGVHSGGSWHFIDINQIPQEAIDIVKKIDDKYNRYSPRFYSIDLMNTSDGFKLVELNSQPGIWHQDRDSSIKKYQEDIIKICIESVKS